MTHTQMQHMRRTGAYAKVTGAGEWNHMCAAYAWCHMRASTGATGAGKWCHLCANKECYERGDREMLTKVCRQEDDREMLT